MYLNVVTETKYVINTGTSLCDIHTFNMYSVNVKEEDITGYIKMQMYFLKKSFINTCHHGIDPLTILFKWLKLTFHQTQGPTFQLSFRNKG